MHSFDIITELISFFRHGIFLSKTNTDTQQKDSKKKFKVRGVIVKVLANTEFRVSLNIAGQETEILAHLSGKMRMHYIKLQVRDEVDVMISPYDLKRGIIVYRY